MPCPAEFDGLVFVLTEFINVTDGRTDGHTLYDGIGRTYIPSRDKNGYSDRYETWDHSMKFVVEPHRSDVLL